MPHPINYRKIGLRLYELRSEQHISQAELAEKADLSVSYISHIENGNKRISLEALICVANALGVSIDQLLNGVQATNGLEYYPEFQMLLSDCSHVERTILYDAARAIKKSLRGTKLITPVKTGKDYFRV